MLRSHRSNKNLLFTYCREGSFSVKNDVWYRHSYITRAHKTLHVENVHSTYLFILNFPVSTLLKMILCLEEFLQCLYNLIENIICMMIRSTLWKSISHPHSMSDSTYTDGGRQMLTFCLQHCSDALTKGFV